MRFRNDVGEREPRRRELADVTDIIGPGIVWIVSCPVNSTLRPQCRQTNRSVRTQRAWTVAEGFVPAARPLRDCGPELQSARRSTDGRGGWPFGINENIDSPFPADYSTGYCWSGMNNGDTQLWRMRNIVWEFCVRRRPCSLTKWFKHGPMARMSSLTERSGRAR